MIWIILFFILCQGGFSQFQETQNTQKYKFNELTLKHDHCRYPQVFDREIKTCVCPEPLTKVRDECVCEKCMTKNTEETYTEKFWHDTAQFEKEILKNDDEDIDEDMDILAEEPTTDTSGNSHFNEAEPGISHRFLKSSAKESDKKFYKCGKFIKCKTQKYQNNKTDSEISVRTDFEVELENPREKTRYEINPSFTKLNERRNRKKMPMRILKKKINFFKLKKKPRFFILKPKCSQFGVERQPVIVSEENIAKEGTYACQPKDGVFESSQSCMGQSPHEEKSGINFQQPIIFANEQTELGLEGFDESQNRPNDVKSVQQEIKSEITFENESESVGSYAVPAFHPDSNIVTSEEKEQSLKNLEKIQDISIQETKSEEDSEQKLNFVGGWSPGETKPEGESSLPSDYIPGEINTIQQTEPEKNFAIESKEIETDSQSVENFAEPGQQLDNELVISEQEQTIEGSEYPSPTIKEDFNNQEDSESVPPVESSPDLEQESDSFSDSVIFGNTSGVISSGSDQASGEMSAQKGTGSFALGTGGGSGAAIAFTGEGFSRTRVGSRGAEASGFSMVGPRGRKASSSMMMFTGEGDAIAINTLTDEGSASSVALATQEVASVGSSAYGAAVAGASAAPGKHGTDSTANYGDNLVLAANVNGGNTIAETISVGNANDSLQEAIEKQNSEMSSKSEGPFVFDNLGEEDIRDDMDSDIFHK